VFCLSFLAVLYAPPRQTLETKLTLGVSRKHFAGRTPRTENIIAAVMFPNLAWNMLIRVERTRTENLSQRLSHKQQTDFARLIGHISLALVRLLP
jgi:hypothetical protein